jgi:hypothetical protein
MVSLGHSRIPAGSFTASIVYGVCSWDQPASIISASLVQTIMKPRCTWICSTASLTARRAPFTR